MNTDGLCMADHWSCKAWRDALTTERERADRAEAEAVEAWRQVHLLKAEASGPDGFATWKDAAIDERLRRVKAEAELAALRADAELLHRIIEAQFIDGFGDVDLHEEAAIAAAEAGREEPNTRDYIAAWRVAFVDAAREGGDE